MIILIFLLQFDNTLSVNPLSIIPSPFLTDFFLAPAINYERSIYKKFSIYGEIQLSFNSMNINPEIGVFVYPLDDFRSLFLSCGVEYRYFEMVRIPLDIGYKWIFSNGFTLRVFAGPSIIFELKQPRGRYMGNSNKYILPDSFGTYFGYSW